VENDVKNSHCKICHIMALVCCMLVGCAPGGNSAARRAMDGQGSLFTPKGQPWTIQCIELRGPYAVDHVEQLAQTLKQTPGVGAKDVFVRHGRDGVSRLYHGIYYRRADSRTGRRSIPKDLREDLALIKELAAGPGKHCFLQAIMAPYPPPDTGNPDWALENVDAAYTLQVAVFLPTDTFHEYKQAGAEYCAYLREQGFEAYYYHGIASSMVTVGAFSEDAVVKMARKVKLSPQGEEGTVVTTRYCDEVVALQSNELLKYNLVNGAKVRERAGRRLGTPVASQLVEVPKRSEVDPW